MDSDFNYRETLLFFSCLSGAEWSSSALSQRIHHERCVRHGAWFLEDEEYEKEG